MLKEPIFSGKSNALKAAIVLQIDRPGKKAPLRFPAVIQNLAAGVATLEVNNPWTLLDWRTLKGQKGRLCLLTGAGKVTDLRGTINWARYIVQGQDSGDLSLGLQLNDQGPAARKLLSAYVPHTIQDLQGFWKQWDQAQVSRAAKTSRVTKIVLASLVLLLTGAMGSKLWGWL